VDAALPIHGAVEVTIFCAECQSAEPRQVEKKQRCRSIDRRRCFVLCRSASDSVAGVGASPSSTGRPSTSSIVAAATVANCPPPGTARSVDHEKRLANCGAVWWRSIYEAGDSRGKKNAFRGRREATEDGRVRCTVTVGSPHRVPSPPSLLRAFPEKSLRCTAVRVSLLGEQRHRTEGTGRTEVGPWAAGSPSTRMDSQNL